MKTKILVTGGSGFIGSALVNRLVSLGKDVVVLDNGSRGSLERLEDCINKIEYFEGDIRDKKIVLNATKGCKSVFHLAFVNGTKYFYEKPELVLDVGVIGAINTIKAAIELGVKDYILASSSEIYQQPTNIPTDEKERAIIPDVLNPRFSYSGGKLISELLSFNFFRNVDLRNLVFRPHNIFGPNMGFEHVIPEIVKKLYYATNHWTDNYGEIQIQGTGQETRAFCFIDDAIDQLIKIYEEGVKGEIYNIGFDDEISIITLVKDIINILNLNIDIKTSNLKSGGTTRRCPNINKIKSLGYKNINKYEIGLEKTVLWYKNKLTYK